MQFKLSRVDQKDNADRQINVDRQTESQSDKHTDRQLEHFDSQTYKLTSRLERQTDNDRQTDSRTDRQTVGQTDRQLDKQTDRK